MSVPSTLALGAPLTLNVSTGSGSADYAAKPIYAVDASAFGTDLLEGKGLVGRVYSVPVDQQNLPDFSKITSATMILAPQLNVPDRNFTEGFPGVPGGLIEWFGIRFDAKLQIPDAGNYKFLMTSDDGSRLYIDGDSVVNDDGLHPMTQQTGTKTLSAGTHTVRIDYFQGPRYDIGLVLQWVRPGTTTVETISADKFVLPDPAAIFP